MTDSTKAEILRRTKRLKELRNDYHRYVSLIKQHTKYKNGTAIRIHKMHRDNCEKSIDTQLAKISKLKLELK